MRKSVATAFAVCLCTSVHAEPQTPKPGGCLSLQATQEAAKNMAVQSGGQLFTYDGHDAHRMMSAINSVGNPTSYDAEHVGILTIPTQNMAMVLMASGPCGYDAKGLRMKLHDISRIQAVLAAESI